MKAISAFFVATILTACLALAQVASASLELTPLGPGLVATGDQTSQAQINAAIAAFLGSSVEIYKADVGLADVGLFASSYSTEFFDTPTDPSGFTVSYDGGPAIADPTHLLVKDGNQEPAWYLFDISAWDGTEDINGSGFWPAQGAISHITIYGGTGVIPEPGTLLIWGGLATIAVTVVRRRRASRM